MLKFTIMPDEFRALASVAVSATTDDITPILQHIHVTATEDGMITATATDRYTVALAEAPGEVETAGEAILPAAEVLAFARKIPKRTAVPLVVTVDEDGWTITNFTSTIGGALPAPGNNFPAVSRLFPDTVTPVPMTSVNPKLVARLAKILTAAKLPATAPWQVAGSGTWRAKDRATSTDDATGPLVFYTQTAASRGNTPIRLWMLMQPNLTTAPLSREHMPMPDGKTATLTN